MRSDTSCSLESLRGGDDDPPQEQKEGAPRNRTSKPVGRQVLGVSRMPADTYKRNGEVTLQPLTPFCIKTGGGESPEKGLPIWEEGFNMKFTFVRKGGSQEMVKGKRNKSFYREKCT